MRISSFIKSSIFTTVSLVFVLFSTQSVLAEDLNNSIDIPSSYQNIGQPFGLDMDSDGNIWFVDRMNSKISKYNPTTNQIIRSVGRPGDEFGEFNGGIHDLAIDNQGFIYVVSTYGHLYKLDSNGGFINKYDLGEVDSSINNPSSIFFDSSKGNLLITAADSDKVFRISTNIQLIASYGSSGSGNGEFSRPWSTYVDHNGKIYVTDENNSRVQVFNSNFQYQFQISRWNNDESGFDAVKDVIVLSDGTITVTSQNANTIEQFDYSGNHIRTFGYDGTGDSNLKGPQYMVKDSNDNIYVSTWGKNFAIKKFSSTGSFLQALTNASITTPKLFEPIDVDFDSNGNMYVLDHERVILLTNSGEYVSTLIDDVSGDSVYHITYGSDDRIYLSNYWGVVIYAEVEGQWVLDDYVGVFETTGNGNGEFDQARGIVLSGTTLYVGDNGNHRVQKFVLSGGEFVYSSTIGAGWNGEGDAPDNLSSQLAWVHDIEVDASGNLYVTDEWYVKKYNSSGVYQGVYGVRDGENSLYAPKYLDISGDILYAVNSTTSDPRIMMYDISTGDYLGRFGSKGGGQAQLHEPTGTKVNPINDSLVICDWLTSRLVNTVGGNRIYNLIDSADVVWLDTDNAGESLVSKTWDPLEDDLESINARLTFGNYVVSDFTVDLTESRDWSGVNVLSLPLDSKALVVNLNESLAPGISSTHSLYVYRYSNQTEVTVCPDATNLSDVGPSCSNAYTLSESNPDLTAVTIDGKNYWKIDGLVGTGAYSTLFESNVDLRDTMTRLQISTPSNHNIRFGTTYNLTHTGDTIRISFGNGWDFTDLTISDLDLIRASDSASLVLASDADVDTWGVNITIDNEIIFTAPTNSDSTESIAADSSIYLNIENESITNPDTVGSYMIEIFMITDDELGGENSEYGSVSVPIIDSDQVNVTGYVNTFISFDIDTGTSDDVNCAFDSCQKYDGAGSADNYTVDLGELNSTWVNKSQDTVFTHSDGGTGSINSIYMDLTSNAFGGVTVYISSANAGLQGPGTNMISSVSNGDNILPNDGKYGYTIPVEGTGNGDVSRYGNCVDLDHYCELTLDANPLFDTNGKPLDGGRVRLDIAAAASYTNNPGLYQDTLTFTATATY